MWRSFSSAFDTLLALQESMEHAMHEDYFGVNTTSRGVYPPFNIFEKGENLVLVAELPGYQKESLNLEVKGNLLRIAGERNLDYGKDVSRHRIERRSNRFDRSLKLPFRVEAEQIKAEYNNGLLVLSLPRAESDKPKQIAIN